MKYYFVHSGKALIFLTIFLVIFPLNLAAQSDYKITQEFKEKYRDIENSIDLVKSLKDLSELEVQIVSLRKNYFPHKELIDKTLFPLDFKTALQNVTKKIQSAKTKLQKINELNYKVTHAQSKISYLTNELEKLSNRVIELKNDRGRLLKEIDQLMLKPMEDEITIKSLNARIVLFKENIRERDSLIMQIIDSIFITYADKIISQSDKENNKLAVKIRSANLLENLKNLIQDNIYFIKFAELFPQDLSDLKDEQIEFAAKWKTLGVSLTNIYSDKEDKQDELNEISGLVIEWKEIIDYRIWTSIHAVLKKAGIDEYKFYNGEEFYNTIHNYITKQVEILSEDTNGYGPYSNFIENVWNNELSKKWTPLLLKNNMITNEQYEDLLASIHFWSSEVSEPLNVWLFLGIGLFFIAFTIILINYTTKKSREKYYE